ncbi:MAG: FAD-binding protein [Streptococcus suis]
MGGVDLVLFGKQTIDSDTGQVGPITAEFLDLPQITNVIDIIGLGRGVTDTETIKIAFEVPNKINAQVGVTRPLTELDIFSIQNQIGQSGHTVKPKVIINLGIQGASQFTTGMDKADLIISINSDRNAPIFDISDYAYAGDVKEFLTELHL